MQTQYKAIGEAIFSSLKILRDLPASIKNLGQPITSLEFLTEVLKRFKCSHTLLGHFSKKWRKNRVASHAERSLLGRLVQKVRRSNVFVRPINESAMN